MYCKQCADKVDDPVRKEELLQMAENTAKVPWNGATNFWEAVQSLWMTHMLVMSDENYPGPGVSFGRIDQYTPTPSGFLAGQKNQRHMLIVVIAFDRN